MLLSGSPANLPVTPETKSKIITAGLSVYRSESITYEDGERAFRGYVTNDNLKKSNLEEMEKMKQVKNGMSDKGANKWLKENQDKEIVDIQFNC